MARKSSDSVPPVEPTANANAGRGALVYGLVSDPSFYARVRSECANLPPDIDFYPTTQQLLSQLHAAGKFSLGFVMLIEHDGNDVDAVGLRDLRLDFPQLIPIAILEKCDKQSELRLQSIGVQRIMLPPFDQIDVAHEIATAIPNAPNFKRHPDLMHRGQARLDFLIPSELSYVLGINYEVSLLLKEFGFSQQDARINIPLACDEAITNAILHGNKSQPGKKVNIQIYVSHSRFRIRVRDQGDGFDADTVADPREGENVHRASGRGIFLMRNIMDSVEYKEGGRVLELEKRNTNSKRNEE